jgi:hypothetical protein
MSTTSVKLEISEEIDTLPPEDQRKVLDFARALADRRLRAQGKEKLRPFAQGFDLKDLEAMRKVIEEDCERVDLSEW